MFLDLFYGLRDEGVPVSPQEWRTLLGALEQGLHGSSLERFYHLARACLVKSETYYDAYDRVFLRLFKGVEGAVGDEVTQAVLDWLKDPKNFPDLTPEQLAALEQLSGDELMRRFLERLAEQTERHDGGDRWVGTGGTLALRPRRRPPDGHPRRWAGQVALGDEGRRRAAVRRLPHGRHARRPPGPCRAPAAAPADAHGRGERARSRGDHRRPPAATPARSTWSSAPRGGTTTACSS